MIEADGPDRATTTPETAPEQADGGTTAPSLGGLAKTMRRRTTDLLALAILVVAGLTFGREISGWLAPEPAGSATEAANLAGPANPDWNDAGRPVAMQFGEAGLTLHRERIAGDLPTAIDRLVSRCTTLLSDRPAPDDLVSDAERRMLTTTVELEPVDRVEGRWSVYFAMTPMPTVIGVLEDQAIDPACPVCGPRRAVCWGVLMGDTEPEHWTAFWFDRRSTANPTDFVAVELPPGSLRTVSLVDEAGAGLVGFEGQGTADEWSEWFDRRHPTDAGWQATDWARTETVRTRRFEQSETGRTVEVRIETDGDRVRGIVATGH